MLITQRSMDQNQWVVLIVKLITNGKEVAIKWRRVRKVNSLNAEKIKEEEYTTHSKIHFLPTSVKIPSGLNWYHQQLLEKCSCKDHHFSYSVTRKHDPHSSSQEHPSNLSRIFTPPGTSGGPTTSLRTVHSPDKRGTCESCYYLPLSFKVKRSLVIIWRSAHRKRACSTLMVCLRCCSLDKQRCTTQMTSHLLAQAGTSALFQPLGHLSNFVTLQSDQGHKNTITLIITAIWMTCQYRSSQINNKWINDKLYREK